MKLHFHKWKRVGKPKRLYFDINGIEVMGAICKCKICGKEKQGKFTGHIIGQIGVD